jgi:hypothetical protein
MSAANALPYTPPSAPPLSNQHAVVQAPVATSARLAKAHQRVRIRNTGEQNYIIQDRFWAAHEIRPGQEVEIDMELSELANLVDQRRPGRGWHLIGPRKGQPYAPHPLLVVDIPAIQARPPEDREQEIAQKMAQLASKESELCEREARLNDLVAKTGSA